MDGSIAGEIAGGFIDGLNLLGKLLGALIIAVVCLSIFSIYVIFFRDNKKFKTTEKPIVAWELKSKGQTVDTVWIYKFK